MGVPLPQKGEGPTWQVQVVADTFCAPLPNKVWGPQHQSWRGGMCLDLPPPHLNLEGNSPLPHNPFGGLRLKKKHFY